MTEQAFILDRIAPHLREFGSHSNLYVLQVPPGASIDAVRAAVEGVWAAHPALRVTLVESDGEARQRVVDSSAPSGTIDLDGAAGLSALLAAQRIGVDPCAGPLARFTLARTGPGQPALLVVFVHEFVADGISFATVLADLGTLFLAHSAGTPAQLPPRADYAECVELLHSYARSAAAREQVAYWTGQPWESLAPAPPGARFVHLQGRVVVDHEEAVLARAVRTAVALGVGVEDVVTAALASAVTEELGGSVCAELVHNGRTLRGPGSAGVRPLYPASVLRTVGPFSTSRLVMLPDGSGREADGYIRDVAAALGAAPNRGADFWLLRYFAGVPELAGVAARIGVPQLYVNYLLGEPYRSRGGEGLSRAAVPVPGPPEGSYPPPFVAVTVRTWRDLFTFHWEFDPDRCPPERAQRIADRVAAVLTQQ